MGPVASRSVGKRYSGPSRVSAQTAPYTLLFDAGVFGWSALMANSVCRRSSEEAISVHSAAPLPTSASACACSGPPGFAASAGITRRLLGASAGSESITARIRAASAMAVARVPYTATPPPITATARAAKAAELLLNLIECSLRGGSVDPSSGDGRRQWGPVRRGRGHGGARHGRRRGGGLDRGGAALGQLLQDHLLQLERRAGVLLHVDQQLEEPRRGQEHHGDQDPADEQRSALLRAGARGAQAGEEDQRADGEHDHADEAHDPQQHAQAAVALLHAGQPPGGAPLLQPAAAVGAALHAGVFHGGAALRALDRGAEQMQGHGVAVWFAWRGAPGAHSGSNARAMEIIIQRRVTWCPTAPRKAPRAETRRRGEAGEIPPCYSRSHQRTRSRSGGWPSWCHQGGGHAISPSGTTRLAPILPHAAASASVRSGEAPTPTVCSRRACPATSAATAAASRTGFTRTTRLRQLASKAGSGSNTTVHAVPSPEACSSVPSENSARARSCWMAEDSSGARGPRGSSRSTAAISLARSPAQSRGPTSPPS